MKALVFSEPGSSEVLRYAEVPDPVLDKNSILMEVKASGLNYADIMRRQGVYPLKGSAPYINGYESAGVVVDTNGHPEFQVGDRIGVADVPFSNASLMAVPASHAIPLPKEISFETAASVLLQGLSAQFLSEDCHPAQENETVVVHAAAGGVGQLLVQICKAKGAKVIGLVSSEIKKQVVRSLGADEVFLYNETWREKIQHLYPKGVDAVFDSIGTTIEDSLKITRVRGRVVFFGMAGGAFQLGDPLYIIGTSKTITGGDLWDYLTSKQERLRRATRLFEWIINGTLKIPEPKVFQLSEGKLAHDLMESRKSTGKIIMIA